MIANAIISLAATPSDSVPCYRSMDRRLSIGLSHTAQTELVLISWEFWSQSKETSNGRHWQLARPSCASDRQTNRWDGWEQTLLFFLFFTQILFIGALFISYVFIFIFIFNFALHLPCQAPKITTIYDEPILWG